MSEPLDIRPLGMDQFETWADRAIAIWYADQGEWSKRYTAYDIFEGSDRCYGLYVAEDFVAVAGVGASLLLARHNIDRSLDVLAALPGPDALAQKAALVQHAEQEAFNEHYATLTTLCPRHELSFFTELGYKVYDDDGGTLQMYKVLTQSNVTRIRFGQT